MNSKKNWIKVFFSLTGIIVFTIGFIVFMGNALKSVNTPIFEVSNEFLTVHRITGYDIDSNYNIYVAVEEASSIQVYNPEGTFIKSYLFNTGGGGAFKFFIDNNDVLRILVNRGEYELEVNDDVAKLVPIKNLNSKINIYDENISSFSEERGTLYYKDTFTYLDSKKELKEVYLEIAPFRLSLIQQFLLMLFGGVLVYLPNKRFFSFSNKRTIS